MAETTIHYGSHGGAECGAHGDGKVPEELLTKDPALVTCQTCRGWLPIVVWPEKLKGTGHASINRLIDKLSDTMDRENAQRFVLDVVRDETRRWRDLFLRYGLHLSVCALNGGADECDCGFKEACVGAFVGRTADTDICHCRKNPCVCR